ncbi:MAG: hypothetical protein WDO24_26930, partial [Pseudomonadota bacterium]
RAEVIDVHLAAVGFDEQLFRHGATTACVMAMRWGLPERRSALTIRIYQFALNEYFKIGGP